MKKIFIVLIILTFNLIYSHSSNYDYNIMELSNRQTLGDINEDGEINIQDVILLVNLVLSNEYNDLADMNGDSIINIFDIIESEIRPIMSDMISKDALIEESAWLTRDMLNSMRIVPRHIKWLLKDLAKKKYQIDLKFQETNKEINFLSRSIYFLGMTILSATFFIGGIIIINDLTVTHLNQIPIVTYVCWGLSIASFIRANMLFKLK